MTLYELTNEYMELYEQYSLTEDEAELSGIMQRLGEIENDDLPAKAEHYAKLIRNVEAESEALKNESKRLRKKAERCDLLVERLKAGIRYAMQQTGAVKIPTSIGTWAIRKNPPKVEIAYTDRIPDEYIRTVNVEYDKKKLKEAIEAGEEIDGVSLVTLEGVTFR